MIDRGECPGASLSEGDGFALRPLGIAEKVFPRLS
jgi:hypothetical protein